MYIDRLILFVTTQCNSKCVMCFNGHSNITDATNELTLEEYRMIAKKIKTKLKSIMLSGGEPSLRKDLPEICQTFYNQCSVKKIELPLNGQDKEKSIWMIEKILRSCPTVQLNVRLSIDGIGEIHDMQRGVNDSFDKVIHTHEAIFDLSKQYANMKRGITTTVTKMNVNQLEKLVNHIHNLPSQPDYHDIMACRIQAEQRTNRELLIDPDEYEKVLKIANRYAFFYNRKRYGGLIMGTVGYLRHNILNYIYLNAYKGRRIIKCKAPEFIRVIEADGRVRSCELKKTVGNIRDYDYDLNKMNALLNLSSISADCACTHPCFIAPSSIYPENFLRSCKSILFDAITFRRFKQ